MDIVKKTIKKKEYYYLEHSYRENGRIEKFSKYIGNKIPKNIQEIKEEQISKFYSKRYYTKFTQIKNAFTKELELMPKMAKEKELETFSTNFTYNTQKIEGSTLSLRETANLLEKGILPALKSAKDVKEAENHKKVFFEMLKSTKIDIESVLTWHKNLFKETHPEIAGKIRNHGVRIAGATFIPPTPVELQPEIENFYKWFNKNKTVLHPIRLSALVHLKFVSIHPFSDGNGRITRLMMNFVLKQHKFPLLDIKYSKRNSYYNALENSSKKKEQEIFVQWFFKRYLDEYKNYLPK